MWLYSRTDTENKSRHSTWVRVYSRCSVACSFCHICLWFQGRRSETQTGTMSQQEHFRQVGDGVSACSSTCAGVNQDIRAYTMYMCIHTPRHCLSAATEVELLQAVTSIFCCSCQLVGFWGRYSIVSCHHDDKYSEFARSWHGGKFSEKFFCYNRPLFISFRLCSHLKEPFGVLFYKTVYRSRRPSPLQWAPGFS